MQSAERVYVTECPRDAMQGLADFIPTALKAKYINKLLKVGFDVIDFGSFVSPKAIPQLKDTQEVLESLDLSNTQSQLLAIIANKRGCENAVKFSQIDLLGYPFSVSETFQLRNTNKTISGSFELVKEMVEIAHQSDKELVIYLSMAYGNPYNDPWNADIVTGWAHEIAKLGIKRIALADTVGIASPEDIFGVTSMLINELKDVMIGVHLHCSPETWEKKVNAAFNAGCRRFDSALKGYGGCPMAEDELVGNLATELLVQYLTEKSVEHGIRKPEFEEALTAANNIFN